MGAVNAKAVLQKGGAALPIAFSAAVPFNAGKSVMPRTAVSGAIAFTVNSSGAADGNSAEVELISDGTNVPTFPGMAEWASSFGYDNSQAGLRNLVQFFRSGGLYYYAISQPLVNTPIDFVAPTAGAAAVENATPAVINLVIGEAADTAAAPSAASFTVSAGHTVSSVAWGTSTRLDITVTPAFVNGEAARTLAYTPGTNPIKDVAGNLMVGFAGKAITNNVGSGYQAETTALLANIASNGGTISGGDAAIIDAFIAGAKSDGFFSKYERIYFFRGDDNASLSRYGPAGLATNNGTTHDNTKGRIGGGANYMRSGWTPSTAQGGFSVYLRTTQASDTTTRIAAGCRDSGSTQVYRLAANVAGDGSTSAGSVAGAYGGQPGAGNVQPAGTGGLVAAHYHVVRQGGSACKVFKNGAQLGSTGSTATTASSPSAELFLFASNAAGTANAFLAANSEVAFLASLSSALSDAEAAAEYTRVQALQTAFGRNV